MNSGEDPYEILGVSRNASKADIKSAYRKLALKFHPDKQKGSEEEKKKSSAYFTKIGNAYEILGDDEKRKLFDRGGMDARMPDSGHEGFRDHSDFFSSSFGGFGRRSSRPSGFTDPFELFERVFREEFGAHSNPFGSSHFGSARSSMFNQDPFSDPFFSDPFGKRDRGMDSGFGMMNSMMNNMFDVHSGLHNNGSRQFSSSFSSSSMGGRNGTTESVSTTTRIINGKRQTVTERTTVKPDGTVETKVETEGDDDFPARYAIHQDNRQYLQNSSDQLQRRKSSRRFRR